MFTNSTSSGSDGAGSRSIGNGIGSGSVVAGGGHDAKRVDCFST